MSWVRVPPEAADFSLEKGLPQVSLNCVMFLCIVEVCLSCMHPFVTPSHLSSAPTGLHLGGDAL